LCPNKRNDGCSKSSMMAKKASVVGQGGTA
jgi:hypothetical protein